LRTAFAPFAFNSLFAEPLGSLLPGYFYRQASDGYGALNNHEKIITPFSSDLRVTLVHLHLLRAGFSVE
jgi:hypothetical protein